MSPRIKKYASNAEKQRAYRLRKRNANVTKTQISQVKIPSSPSPSRKILHCNNPKTLEQFKSQIETLGTLESKRLLKKLQRGSANNVKYIERIVNDVLRCLNDL